MDNKTTAIVSYITLIGWVIAYVVSGDKKPRHQLVSYHLKQALGLIIVSVLFSVALTIVASVIPALGFLSFVSLAFLILLVLGIINAANEQMKPIPVIGKFFEDKFAFLN